MILYRKAGIGLPVKTEQGDLRALQGNDSLNTMSGQATHAARGFNAPIKGYNVTGDQMVNGKRQLNFTWNGGSQRRVNQRQAMQQARSSYLAANPNSTNTAAPDLYSQYIAKNTRAPLPAPTPKAPLMSQSAWQENRDRTRRNNANAIAPVRSQSTGIASTPVKQSGVLGLDGKPQRTVVPKVTF